MKHHMVRLLRYAHRILRLFTQIKLDLRVHLNMRHNTTQPFARRVFNQLRLLINSGTSARHYYLQALWNPSISTVKRYEYLGSFGSWEWQTAMNIDGYTALLDDKLLFDIALRSANIPTATTLAIYSKITPCTHYPVLRDIAAFEEWFVKNGENTFIKPLRGINGRGTLSIGNRLATTPPTWEQLPLKQALLLNEIVGHIRSQNGEDFIIQTRLTPNAEASRFSEQVLHTLRVMTLQCDHGIDIVAAALKIGSGKSAADNLLYGNNMVAAVNLDNGELSAAVEVINGEPAWHVRHPISNAPIEGFRLHNIDEIKLLVMRAAENFPWFKSIGWDVGLTADGPLIIEGNYWANFLLIQIAHQKGILSWPQYRTFFKDNKLYRRIGMGFMQPLPD